MAAGMTGACSENPPAAPGSPKRATKPPATASPSSERLVPGLLRPAVAVGWAPISVMNCGTGRAFISAARTESRTKS